MNLDFKMLSDMQAMNIRLDPSLYILALGSSLVAALLAGFLYQFFYENRATGSQVYRSFPLLSISITTLFIGVQLSLPLSLGLLGALSIIRFRTPIKEPEEVGFIMLVIASSISCATFNFQFLAVLYLFAILALVIVKLINKWSFNRSQGMLILSIENSKKDKQVDGVIRQLEKHLPKMRLENVNIDGDKIHIQATFNQLKSEIGDLKKELESQFQLKNCHLYFNRPGGLR